MKRRIWFSLLRLTLALAVFIAAILPTKMNAITCNGAIYSNGLVCYQCYVYSPVGWIPVGPPKWVSLL
jgi:hypothetical protein